MSGVISGQVKLLIKQICNLKYNTGTLILKQLISIPKSSMCLVFEEPLQSFYKHNTSGWLESLGQLHPLRLQHVKKLHIIVESENMAYIARHGGGVHYESCYGDIVAILEQQCHTCSMRETLTTPLISFTYYQILPQLRSIQTQ